MERVAPTRVQSLEGKAKRLWSAVPAAFSSKARQDYQALAESQGSDMTAAMEYASRLGLQKRIIACRFV